MFQNDKYFFAMLLQKIGTFILNYNTKLDKLLDRIDQLQKWKAEKIWWHWTYQFYKFILYFNTVHASSCTKQNCKNKFYMFQKLYVNHDKDNGIFTESEVDRFRMK